MQRHDTATASASAELGRLEPRRATAMTGYAQVIDGPKPPALEWWETDPNQDRCYSHVLLFRGFDLSAAGIWEHDIAPCLLCAPLAADSDSALILTDETLHSGRLIHFVCCGNCGTRGPWASSESSALAQWNAAHRQHNVRGTQPEGSAYRPAMTVPNEWLVKVRRLASGFEHVAGLARMWEPDHSTGSERVLWARASEAYADVAKLLAEDQGPDVALCVRQRPATKG
jgi:hypothetical protein